MDEIRLTKWGVNHALARKGWTACGLMVPSNPKEPHKGRRLCVQCRKVLDAAEMAALREASDLRHKALMEGLE